MEQGAVGGTGVRYTGGDNDDDDDEGRRGQGWRFRRGVGLRLWVLPEVLDEVPKLAGYDLPSPLLPLTPAPLPALLSFSPCVPFLISSVFLLRDVWVVSLDLFLFPGLSPPSY